MHGTTPTGGVEMHVLQTTRELARRGHRIDLLHVERGSFGPEYRQFCHSVTKVPTVDYWFPEGRRGRMRQWVELAPAIGAATLHRPDVLYGNRVISTGWAVPAGRLTGAPIVCHLHGHTDLDPRRIAFLNRNVDRFIVISEFVADLRLASGLDPAKTGVVHNGIDPAEYPYGGLEERSAAPERARGARRVVRRHLRRKDRPREGRRRAAPSLASARPRSRRGPAPDRRLVDGRSRCRLLPGRAGWAGRNRRALPPRTLGHRDPPARRRRRRGALCERTLRPDGDRGVVHRPTGTRITGRGIPEILAGPFERFLFERGDVDGLAGLLAATAGWRRDEPQLAALCAARVQQGFTLTHMVDGIERAFRSVS